MSLRVLGGDSERRRRQFSGPNPIFSADFSTGGGGALPPGATFSRGSAATYYNQSGLLAYAPENLLPNSEQIDLWTKVYSTVTANAAVAPDGITSADKIVAAANLSSHYVGQTLSLGAGTFSAYLKAGEYTWAVLGTGVANEGVWFDLANGVIGTAQSAASGYVITSVGNGWFRCSIYSVGATNLQIVLSTGNGILAFTGNAVNGIYAWGAQFNPGSTATAYVPTTTVAVYGPRFDYDPGNVLQQNLLVQSQTFETGWSLSALAFLTPNVTVAPDGTFTADLMVPNATVIDHRVTQIVSVNAGVTYTTSIYSKAAGYPYIEFVPFTTPSNTVASFTTTSIDVGNGWLLRTCTFTVPTGDTAVQIRVVISNGATQAFAGDGTSGVYIWGAQLNVGSTALPYLATTSTTQAVCAPRGLLIEEARTNLLLQSNDFQTSWTPTNITRTLNSTLSPEGVVNGVKIEATAAAGTSLLQTAVVPTTSATGSVYVKQGTSATIANGFLIRNATTATILLAGTLNYSTGVFTYTTGVSGATATNVGNGWWRLQLSVTTGITSGDSISFYTGWNGISATAGDFLYAYGAQLEFGAFATSYIPTGSTSVARAADSLTMSSISSWFNQTAGSVVWQGDSLAPSGTATYGGLFEFDDGTSANRVGSYISASSNQVGTRRDVASVQIGNLTSNTITTGTAFKYATNWTSASLNGSLNGGSISNVANTALPTTNRLTLGLFDAYLNGHIRSFSYYNSALTNTQLQALTT